MGDPGDLPEGQTYFDQHSPSARLPIIEECCAGTVVGRLPHHPAGTLTDTAEMVSSQWYRLLSARIPIANAPSSLLEAVAEELATRPHAGYSPTRLPPFAAAYTDANGVRTYVLRAGECPACDGNGETYEEHEPWATETLGCGYCEGTGTRADVGAIARCYGGDGDARTARFEVKA